MNRKRFLQIGGIAALSYPMMKSLQSLQTISDTYSSTAKMPVFFLGHGSPMNAIEDNEFVRGFKQQGEQLDKPNAILVVSAHWETKGTYVTAMEQPRTIHDFGGFPARLYEEQYPAPGSPQLAEDISQIVKPDYTIDLDDHWGLDHGAWTVVKHMFPNADVPVIQLSLDYTKGPAYHYAIAQQLRSLRHKGVLIIGSGNIIHNLRMVAWDKLSVPYAYDWAEEADQKIKTWIREGNHKSLIDFRSQGKAFDLAIPTPEHYLPLLYSLALQDDGEELQLFNDQPIGGSLTMTSVKIG